MCTLWKAACTARMTCCGQMRNMRNMQCFWGPDCGVAAVSAAAVWKGESGMPAPWLTQVRMAHRLISQIGRQSRINHGPRVQRTLNHRPSLRSVFSLSRVCMFSHLPAPLNHPAQATLQSPLSQMHASCALGSRARCRRCPGCPPAAPSQSRYDGAHAPGGMLECPAPRLTGPAGPERRAGRVVAAECHQRHGAAPSHDGLHACTGWLIALSSGGRGIWGPDNPRSGEPVGDLCVSRAIWTGCGRWSEGHQA